MRVISNIDSIKKRVPKEQDNNWFVVMFLAVALGLGVLFLTTERMLCSKLHYELMNAKATYTQLVQVNKQLSLEKASLESPALLEKQARKMGLRPPKQEQVVPIEIR